MFTPLPPSHLVSQLEPFYPNVHEVRYSRLVKKTLQGCHNNLS
jgi:hypothetical protein